MKKKVLSFYLGFHRDIYILFIAKVINAIGTFVLPFLSLYLTKKFKMGQAEVGAIITITSLSYLPGAFIGGKLSDRFSNKRLIVVGQILSALCLLSVVFVNLYILKIILIIFSFMIGAAVIPAMDTFIAKKIEEKDRHNVYSFMYLGLNIGYAVGTLSAGLLFNVNSEFIFLGDAITTIISCILILVLVKETSVVKKGNNNLEGKSKNEKAIFQILKKDYKLVFLILTLFYAFCYAQNNFALPLDMSNKLSGSGPKYYGFLMSANGIGVMLFTPLITKWTKRFRSGESMCLAGLLYALGFGGYYLSHSFVVFLLFTMLWTIGEILFSINYTIFLIENVEENYIGRTISSGYIITKLGTYMSPLIIGKYAGIFSISSAWILIFIVMTLATVGMKFIDLKLNYKAIEISSKGNANA